MPMTTPGFGRFVEYFKSDDNVSDELCCSQMDYKLWSKDQQQCTFPLSNHANIEVIHDCI